MFESLATSSSLPDEPGPIDRLDDTVTLNSAIERLLRLDRPHARPEPFDPMYLHDLGSAGHAVCGALFAAERRGESVEVLKRQLARVREMHARAPFIARLQTWPRGYPGDFETIEYLWRGRAAGTDLTGACLERLALNSPIAQQHRNKVVAQASRIRHAVSRRRARILVLACGSSPDLRTAGLSAEDLVQVDITLTDADPDALEFSRVQLGDLAGQCEFVAVDALRALRRASGPFDLILAGGLFDYLADRLCRRIIGLAVDRLAAGGEFFFTNIAAGNPYRTWIEYFGDWRLIERSEADLRELIEGLVGCECDIEREQTGLALLASVTRRHA